MGKTEFETEWCLLKNQFESYEKHSLYKINEYFRFVVGRDLRSDKQYYGAYIGSAVASRFNF